MQSKEIITRESIKAKLFEILTDDMGIFSLDISDEKLLEDLGMDSLDKLELANICEEKFSINNINDEDIKLKMTVSDLVDHIYNLKK